jgi:tricorn protease
LAVTEEDSMQLRPFLGRTLVSLLLCHGFAADAADDPETRLVRQPAISRDHLAFVYGGDIWVSDRDGEHPVRITTHPASEFAPHFSPDSRWIAFSARYDDNTDVYVVPVGGGQPRRLTWHPASM